MRAGGRRRAPTTAAAATSHKRRSLIISRTSLYGVRDQLLNLYDGAANTKRVKINHTAFLLAIVLHLKGKTPGLFQALYTFSLSFPAISRMSRPKREKVSEQKKSGQMARHISEGNRFVMEIERKRGRGGKGSSCTASYRSGVGKRRKHSGTVHLYREGWRMVGSTCPD